MQILDVMKVRYSDDDDGFPIMRVIYSDVYAIPEVTLIDGEKVTVVALGEEFDEEGNPLYPLVRFADGLGDTVAETEGYVLAKYLVPVAEPEPTSPSDSAYDLISGGGWQVLYEGAF